MQIHPTDRRITWHGAVSLEHTESHTRAWRLPWWDIDLFPGKMLQERAEMPAGVRISFYSTTTFLRGRVVRHGGAVSPIDLCCNGEVVGSRPLDRQDAFAFEELPEGRKLLELWLPQFGRFGLESLEVSDDATIEPFIDERPRWAVYGSSITQSRNATSPTATWPALVARGADLNLTCLGFNGECHLDAMVARVVRDLQADFFSMCVGVNIYGKATLNDRSFRAALISFVRIVREAHPSIPIVVMSPIHGIDREDRLNSAGLSYALMRAAIAECVDSLVRCGDPDITVVNGLDIFGPADECFLDDNVHPSAEGTVLLGRRFLEKVVPLVSPRLYRRVPSRFERDYLASIAVTDQSLCR